MFALDASLSGCIALTGQQLTHVKQRFKDRIERRERGEVVCLSKCEWASMCKPFVVPGDGYWLDGHDIKRSILLRARILSGPRLNRCQLISTETHGATWCSKLRV